MLYSDFVSRMYYLYNSDFQNIDESEQIEEHKGRIQKRIDDKGYVMDENAKGQYRAFAKKYRVSESRVRLLVRKWLYENPKWTSHDIISPFPGERGRRTTLRSLMRYDNWDDFIEGVGDGRRQGNYVTLIALAQIFHTNITLLTSLKGKEEIVEINYTQVKDEEKQIIKPNLNIFTDMERNSDDEFSYGDVTFSKKRKNSKNSPLLKESSDNDMSPKITLQQKYKKRYKESKKIKNFTLSLEKKDEFIEPHSTPLDEDLDFFDSEIEDLSELEESKREKKKETSENEEDLENLIQIVDDHEKTGGVETINKHNEKTDEIDDNQDSDEDENEESEEDKNNIHLYHYYKNYYGGLLKKSQAEKVDDLIWDEEMDDKMKQNYNNSNTMMQPEEGGMRLCYPSGSSVLGKLSLILSFLTGVWWIIYLPIWGQDYTNGWSILGFIIFFISELINFILGTIYTANFLFPVTRRWKSLNHLSNKFSSRPKADCMIFHYTESLDTTAETLKGCLGLDTFNKVQTNVYICDDGFWQRDKPNANPLEKPIYEHKKISCNFFGSIIKKILFCFKCCCDFRSKKNQQQQQPQKRDPELYESFSTQQTQPKNSINENEALQWIREKYQVVPTEMGKGIVKKIATTLKNFYQDKYRNLGCNDEFINRIKIYSKCNLTKLVELGGGLNGFGVISRRDCAVASLCYVFYVDIPDISYLKDKNIKVKSTSTLHEKKLNFDILQQNHTKAPLVHIVARVKPPKHHYKAGNINNCIYNEMDHDNDRFVCFFDNDMKPEPPFLMRTLPFFYSYDESAQQFIMNRRVSFVQTPQYFTEDTVAPVLDYLASKNSIFFQAIQKGRDGFKACAFAGTNAVFRVGALYAIGGMPYGSVTEDALAGRYLHKAGYRSVYAEEILAIGEAPTTVASAMKQRMRWCKGSVQILLLKFFGLQEGEEAEFHPGLEPEKEETDSFRLKMLREDKIIHTIVQKAFSIDTMTYPLSAITAIGYMFVALIFVMTAIAPLTFTTQYGYWAFIFTFVPYFAGKFLTSFTAYTGKVDADEIWIAQQVWFGYAFCAVVGIFDALRQQFTGRGLSWGVTGEAERRNWLEYFNVIMVFLLCVGIAIRTINMFVHVETSLIDMGAIFFAGTIVYQMWPMVSMSLYEWIYNTALDPSERDELKRFTIPTYVVYVILLILIIAVGVTIETPQSDEDTNNFNGISLNDN